MKLSLWEMLQLRRASKRPRPMKPCVICGGTGKVRQPGKSAVFMTAKEHRGRIPVVDCAFCAGGGKVYLSEES
jgi:RecJ-like exonuclease